MAQRFVAVFEDEERAQAAADAARQAGATEVTVGARADHQASLRGEMREEMEHTTAGAGNVGPFTKEMTKGLLAGTLLGGLVGALVGIPAGFVPFGDVSLAVRLVITVGVGLAAGSTFGFVMGGGLGAKGPVEELAAERGVTVSATADDLAVADALRRHSPLRIDVLQGAQPVDTVTSDDPTDEDGVVREVRGTIVHSEGDWTPVQREHERN